jgi:hypothetical protein
MIKIENVYVLSVDKIEIKDERRLHYLLGPCGGFISI